MKPSAPPAMLLARNPEYGENGAFPQAPSVSGRAAVFTPFFVDRDAVSNDVLHSTRVLRAAGWDARVFSIGAESAREKSSRLEELSGFLRDREDLLYFH